MSHVKQISFPFWTTPICNEQLFIDKWNARYWGNGVYGTQSTPKIHLRALSNKRLLGKNMLITGAQLL